MSTWIVDDRGGVCEQCDRSFQSLSLHWSRNQHCSYPPVADSITEVVRGCLLGDGSLDSPNDGAPALRISSMRRDHLTWVHEQLDWLLRGITHDSRDAYRLRTMSHPLSVGTGRGTVRHQETGALERVNERAAKMAASFEALSRADTARRLAEE